MSALYPIMQKLNFCNFNWFLLLRVCSFIPENKHKVHIFLSKLSPTCTVPTTGERMKLWTRRGTLFISENDKSIFRDPVDCFESNYVYMGLQKVRPTGIQFMNQINHLNTSNFSGLWNEHQQLFRTQGKLSDISRMIKQENCI